VKIKLGVNKSDRLYAMEAGVLAQAGIPTSSVFALHFTEPPISAPLLAFLRIFCMTEEELKEHLLGDSAIDRIFTLGNAEFPVSWDNEVKLWTFLEDRASLLLKTYKTTIEKDKIVLKNPDLLAIKLLLGEKEILKKAVKCTAMNREYYCKHMEERLPLPRYKESDMGLLEGDVGDSRLPLVLRKLENKAGVQESLSLTEAVSKVKAAKNGLINGENSIPNRTRSENESFSTEESENVTGEGTTLRCSWDPVEQKLRTAYHTTMFLVNIFLSAERKICFCCFI
jgi:histone-lysine N-methyltransferase SETD3